MNVLGSTEAVLAAIREDARAEADRLEREGEAAVRRLREQEASLPVVVPDGEARIGAARRAARERRARDDWSDREGASKAREAWMARVAAAAKACVASQPPSIRQARLLRLAVEALEALAAADCELIVATSDVVLADEEWRRAVEQASGKRVTVSASTAVDGGCIAQTRSGRVRFDNTDAARTRRFETRWRQALGVLFDGTVKSHG